MRRMYRLRIKNGLFLQVYISFGVVLTLFALIIGSMYLNLYEENIIKSYKKQLKSQVEQIGQKMSQFISENDTQGSLTYMEYLVTLENSNTTDIWLIKNPDSEEYLEKEFTNADISHIDLSEGTNAVIKKAKKGKISYKSGYDSIYERTMMCVAAPIYNAGGKIVGIALLNSYVEERDAMIQASRKYILYSIVAGILISLLLALVLAKVITKPISAMRRVALELAKGNYERRTKICKNNEIGVLAQSMDKLAEKLEKNESERNAMEQMRLDFFANVSHELRTPITVMRGYAETLADGIVTVEEKKQKYYQRMVAECQGMERLVGDLLTLSKVQNPHFEIVKEPVNLIQIFYDILRNYKKIAQEKELQLQLRKNKDWVVMQGDYDRLRQLFQNILDNAMKFSPPNSTIRIDVEEAEKIKVIIEDEGVGIAEEELPYIFEKFYKSKLCQNEKGSGLGLVIVKYIVEKHDGNIQVESKVGKGTKFTFTFEKIEEDMIEDKDL